MPKYDSEYRARKNQKGKEQFKVNINGKSGNAEKTSTLVSVSNVFDREGYIKKVDNSENKKYILIE